MIVIVILVTWIALTIDQVDPVIPLAVYFRVQTEIIIKERVMNLPPFHLAIQVANLSRARHFYTHILKCSEGRSSKSWVDLNFFGHQLVLHENVDKKSDIQKSAVDGHGVPVPHFGVVLEMSTWERLAEDLKRSGVKFEIEPYIRFKGMVGEQGTMFFFDTEHNAIEIKAFRNIETELFAKD